MNPILVRESLRALAWAALGAGLGAIGGGCWQGVALALALCLFRALARVAALRRWLEAPKRHELPIVGGIWGEVYDGLLTLQKRNRKRKRRLAAIVAEFQASTAALPDGAVVLGGYGEIAWFNPAAQALLGLRLPQDLGIRIPNLVRNPIFAEYFAAGEYGSEVVVPSPVNKDVMLSFRIIPYGNGQRLLIVRDVSEIHRLDIARRDFVANASHELRTPLTVLRGYLDMMEPDTGRSGPLADWAAPVGEMRAQATRMESLIADLLRLARLESDAIHKPQDLLDVPRLLTTVEREARAMSAGRHRIQFDVQPDLRLFGRESELQSIFGNLVSNAINYTGDGGIIDVRWWGDERGVHFSVADTGVGIAEKDLSRITERFYRVDTSRSRATGGTGLGLSIVKHALEHHEGRLEIDSELGVGSTFTCHFPPHRVHLPALRSESPPLIGPKV